MSGSSRANLNSACLQGCSWRWLPLLVAWCLCWQGTSAQYAALAGKAPAWYHNFPPWWITPKKFDAAGYTNQMVTVAPIHTPRPPPPQSIPQGYPELKEIMKNRIVPPPGTPPQIKRGFYNTAHRGSSNAGDMIYDAIKNAQGTTRSAGKPLEGMIAELQDPTFAAVRGEKAKNSPLTFLQTNSQIRWLEADKPLSYYNHNTPGYRRSWDPDNKDQVYPLWDPFWQNHPNIMPTLANHYISRNAFFNYHNSPINLYYRAEGYRRPDDGTSTAGGVAALTDTAPAPAADSAPAATPMDSDDSW